MSLDPGTKLGRYEIRSKIGEGGMGEVYLAEDTKLHRRVAIKFIPTDSVARDDANRRLMREAQAAAKLDHPNICAVHEVAEDAATFFHVEMFDSIGGRQAALFKEREMENAYLKALKLPENFIFVRDQGAAWEVFTIGAYRDLKHFAESASISEADQNTAAKAAGFAVANPHRPLLANPDQIASRHTRCQRQMIRQ